MKIKQVRPKDLVKALLKKGFVIKRKRGSHVFLEAPFKTENKFTSVSLHAGTLPKGTLKGILKQTGLSEDELMELI